jgi:hypothetical protein
VCFNNNHQYALQHCGSGASIARDEKLRMRKNDTTVGWGLAPTEMLCEFVGRSKPLPYE